MIDRYTIVIFGASGDLTRRKLVPSLFELFRKGSLPEGWNVIGVSRTEMTNQAFREHVKEGVKEFARSTYEHDDWEEFAANIAYFPGDLTNSEDLEALDRMLAERCVGGAADNRVYHMSVAPRLYVDAISCMGASGMFDESAGWRRVIIEKPFGHDLASARTLNKTVHANLEERQAYRIDHYLGKETVQNILVFRFANSMFEPVWNRNYIDHVQITAAESVDVGHRAGFYDSVGVVRDMIQNHVLQLLALVAAEPPASFDADAIRNERAKVLNAVRPMSPEDFASRTVRGQYVGYRDCEGVAADSQTATFAALQLYIDNWRWQGVPFFIRSGKALAAKLTEITILFKRPPHLMFPMSSGSIIGPNQLTMCIQPDEGIHLSFQAKVPDTQADMRPVDMSFHYDESFGPQAIPEAYERLLLDALKGDASLFTRSDSIELAWALVDPILEAWDGPDAPPLRFYEKGSWGPDEADELIAHDGYCWVSGCMHETP